MMGISDDEDLVEQILEDVSTVLQVDDDTIRVACRTETRTDWPPAPPLSPEEDLELFGEDIELAVGTLPGAPRQAGFYRAVHDPDDS